VKNVQKIIDAFSGLAALEARRGPLKVEAEGFMPLVIEHAGRGPRGLPLVSVGHYFVQASDRMSDPEMTFEVDGQGGWPPVARTQSPVGAYHEVAFSRDGQVYVRPAVLKDLYSFARLWDKSIGEQGFVQAAREVKK
jgi:hypothetical protein